jgi:hypothetical protein
MKLALSGFGEDFIPEKTAKVRDYLLPSLFGEFNLSRL